MGYASRSGRAKTSASNPQAHAICDRCAFRYNHVDLKWQYDWAGASLINKRILVCNNCYDDAQQQLRAIVVPADPVPIINPRVEPYAWDEIDRRQISGANTVNAATGIPVQLGDIRVTSKDDVATNNTRVTQQTGEPPYGTNQKPGTDPNAVSYRDITNVTNNGLGLIRITVSVTSGFITGQRAIISNVEGSIEANDSWIITVVNTTQIDLQDSVFVNAYTSGGYIINDPSLPYEFDEVPKTGPL
ncbi:hypothetical protein UFOVP1518_7 [uncultured Caudovirales phage]|jgi:hypothetical protein|uniref:Uncharacterized protein n=3 Tax=uncultured Caudovirales phage TaxID=2100421 RepID=A0A6J5PCB8_9CAUD|nr:hypothetical protein UFOVP475_20 [uncultured Caudovirales phage]CAB4169550.1 hypothetical protein UFOVP897_50 [uncultured Caudovirales phage]CAB4175800.1 hypothetical protein UFOVP984_20 [uncultured Caudovirales phage]CAB4181661.1 hypothetical protein UFOVP1072_53 [uncultured Caudovirales phage]CAB4191314.1 hypothetical protein UFOVP1211_19 [uncultured Caudovirales phage]